MNNSATQTGVIDLRKNNMTDLEKKIAELTADHNFKTEMESLFGNIPHLAYSSKSKESDFTITIQLTKYSFPELISNCLKDILILLPVTNKETVLGNSSKTVSYSPFRFDYSNNVNESYVLVSYYSNRIHVRIEVPLSFYSEISKRGTRKVSDCETHYFGGVSQQEINNMKLIKYSCQYFDEVNWYGGDVSVYCKSPEWKEQFNEMVLTGKHV